MGKKHQHLTFKPAFGLSHRHSQTIFSTLFRKPIAPVIRVERFTLADGDFVECYWHQQSFLSLENTHKPIVTLFHGLEGSFASPYIQGIMNALHEAGFCPVLMHFRGCSGLMNILPRSYHSGDTADARQWLNTLHARYPEHPLLAIGYSLGGNMLLKLLGEDGHSSSLNAAVAVSAPLKLDLCAKQMNQGFSQLYQYRLLKNLKRHLLKKYQQHDMKALIGIDEQQVKQLTSFWAFDDVYTGPIHGFSSAQDYYQQSSSQQYLSAISTETLLIHALDDPFMTPKVIPDKSQLSRQITFDLQATGGHLGFVSGHIFKPSYWLDERIVDFLTNRS